MSDDELNMDLAAALAWTDIFILSDGLVYGTPPVGNRCKVPNYAGDLNACHKVERGLGYRYNHFQSELEYISDNDKEQCIPTISATARQRAEALLKTLVREVV